MTGRAAISARRFERVAPFSWGAAVLEGGSKCEPERHVDRTPWLIFARGGIFADVDA